jgi:hypothetical protein
MQAYAMARIDGQARRAALGAMIVAAWVAPGVQAEPPRAGEEEALLVLVPAWPQAADAGAGIPAACGGLGTPLFLGAIGAGASDFHITADGAPLADPQRAGVDWSAGPSGLLDFQAFSPSGWEERYRDGCLDGSLRLRSRSGMTATPVSRAGFLQGPRGHKRSAAEFGRSVGTRSGFRLNVEESLGTPTESSIRHEFHRVGVVFDRAMGASTARVSLRKYEGDRTSESGEAPVSRLLSAEDSKEMTASVVGPLSGGAFSLVLWSRDLSFEGRNEAGTVLGGAGHRMHGGSLDLGGPVWASHRWSASLVVERTRASWAGDEDLTEWRTGAWLGDEADLGDGKLRAGFRGETYDGHGSHWAGEVGWSQSGPRGEVDVTAFRAFRTPSEIERRACESEPEAAVRTGLRAALERLGARGSAGVRAHLWEEAGHCVAGLGTAPGWDERWLLTQETVRSLGAVLWARWAGGEGSGASGALRLERVRSKDGDSVPGSPGATLSLSAEARRPLPLREMAVRAGLAAFGWTAHRLPEGGEADPGLSLHVHGTIELASLRFTAGIRNLLGAPVAESPVLPVRDRWSTEVGTPVAMPRYGDWTERETYFSVSLTLFD